MKSANNMVVVATMAALAFAGAAAAQAPDLELGRKWCGPTGTWIGQNDTYGLELVVTIVVPHRFDTSGGTVLKFDGQTVRPISSIIYSGLSKYVLPVFIVLMLIEIGYGHFVKDQKYKVMDTVSSISSGLTNILKDSLGLGVILVSYPYLVEHLSLIHLEATWLVWLVAFLANFTVLQRIQCAYKQESAGFK